MNPGDRAIWLYEARGGWGYVFRVPAIIIRKTPKRVLIEVKMVTGEIVQRWVHPEKLQPDEVNQ